MANVRKVRLHPRQPHPDCLLTLHPSYISTPVFPCVFLGTEHVAHLPADHARFNALLPCVCGLRCRLACPGCSIRRRVLAPPRLFYDHLLVCTFRVSLFSQPWVLRAVCYSRRHCHIVCIFYLDVILDDVENPRATTLRRRKGQTWRNATS